MKGEGVTSNLNKQIYFEHAAPDLNKGCTNCSFEKSITGKESEQDEEGISMEGSKISSVREEQQLII